jgi:hypothetical protein
VGKRPGAPWPVVVVADLGQRGGAAALAERALKYAKRAAKHADVRDETVRFGGSTGDPELRAAGALGSQADRRRPVKYRVTPPGIDEHVAPTPALGGAI